MLGPVVGVRRFGLYCGLCCSNTLFRVYKHMALKLHRHTKHPKEREGERKSESKDGFVELNTSKIEFVIFVFDHRQNRVS